ncbi:MAG: ATP-binding protein [Candidatus Omnitrophica bacterium]|nr:ATP-binding protein [Candidatus Omnitrophota bacterium]
MIKSNPFTPQSGWEPRIFAGRHPQIISFRRTLSDCLERGPSHMVVLGQWGIGKTSLLKQYKKIVQEEGGLAALCPMSKSPKGSTVRDGIRLIIEEIIFGIPKLKNTQGFLETLEGAGITIAGFGAHFARKKRSLQPQVELTEFLLKMWPHLGTKLAVILLDDIQNFMAVSSVIDILRSVLSKEEVVSQCRYLFVLSSTRDAWEEFIDKHDPVGRFFRKREYIENLGAEEVGTLITNSLRTTGVTFAGEVIEQVFRHTQGHPYEVQLLCSHLYESQIEGTVTIKEWPHAFTAALRELGRDYFDSMLRKSSDRERIVLEVLAELDKEATIKEIQQALWRRHKNFPLENVKNFLYRSENKGLIKKAARGSFRILDPMLAAYIRQSFT